MATRNKRGLIIGGLALLIALIAIVGILLSKDDDEEKNTDVNSPVVELVLREGEVVHVPIEDFSAYLEDADKPVFVDFWAEWCPPCKAAAPFVETLAEEYDGQAHIVKVNVDYAGDIAGRYRVQSIPLFVMIEDSETVDSQVGYSESLQGNLRDMIEKRLP